MTKEQKRVVVITGIRPTFQLYEPLSKHYTVAVFDSNAAMQLSAQTGKPVLCPMNGAGQPLFEKARNDAARYAAHVVNTADALRLSLNGRQPEPIADVMEWLPGLTMGYLPNIAAYLRVLNAYADSEGVDIAGIIAHEDVTPVFRSLALWGKARGIPVIHIPHGNCFATVRPDVHDECVSDWILAASPYMRDWYGARGFDKQRIKITGFGPWDEWAGDLVTQTHARRVLSLEEDRPTLALCTGWPQRTNLVDDHVLIDAAVNVTLHAARKNEWQVIWKIHPGDAPGQEQRAAQLAAQHRVSAVATRDHLHLTLRAADVVLSVGPSNVLVEAGLCDRPPVLFDLRGYGFEGEPPWRVEADPQSVTDVVTSLLDVAKWLDARQGFVKRYAFKNDGKGIKRTMRQIKAIVDG